jgi:hypothetical protein
MGPLPVQRRSQTRDDATGSTRSRLDLLVEISRQLGTGLDADALTESERLQQQTNGIQSVELKT